MFVPYKADVGMIQEQWVGDTGTEEKPSWYGVGFRQPLTKVADVRVCTVEPSPTATKSGGASSSQDPAPHVVPPLSLSPWIRDRPRIVMPRPRPPQGRPPAHLLPPPPPPKPPNFVYVPPPPPSPRCPPPPAKKTPTPPKYPPPPKPPQHFEVVEEEDEDMEYDDTAPDWDPVD